MKAHLRAPAVVRMVALIAVATFGVVVTPGVASAKGTILIQHVNTDGDTYQNVKIQIIHNTLNVTSEDGQGTLIVTRAACAYQGKILTCLPTGVTLIQSGSVHALDLEKGTLYLNMTDETQQMSFSSQQLPPRGVVMTLKTEKGTYINLTGKIDKVTS